jgi:hypothetical protein
MIESFSNILSSESIQSLLNNSDVLKAKESIEYSLNKSITFTINLSDSIKRELYNSFQLDLTNINNVPMRWIKGDTLPHIDKNSKKFEKTYLVYLTDNEGNLLIDDVSYPIKQNVGYKFSEGLNHSTINTNEIPRLLIGPMSEEGLAVGLATTIIANGQTDIIYFKSFGLSVEYKINDGPYNGFSLPITIINSNTPYQLKVLFENDLTIQLNIFYFICGSDGIQFGSSSLNNDGSRPIITIDGITDYPGLIKNGDGFSNGFSNIYVYNLEVNVINGSTLETAGGWIGQLSFSKNATNNYIINCSSNGPINNGGGGIVGQYTCYPGGNMTIQGCSSYGAISGYYAGGIVGLYGGIINCYQCWSEGIISGTQAGGIFGAYSISASCTARYCYSLGTISGGDAGGIFGAFGNGLTEHCYSKGNIQGGFAGGIFGANTNTASATDCYSAGSIGLNSGGIFGAFPSSPSPATNCYTYGVCAALNQNGSIIAGTPAIPVSCAHTNDGSWSSAVADTVLIGVPSPTVGTNWIYAGLNQPYELRYMGYTPYTIMNILNNSPPSLNIVSNQTINAGNSSNSAIVSGKAYTILQTSPSTPSITINSTSGVISTTSSTPVGTYTIIIRNNGSYNVSEFSLVVNSPSPPTPPVPCLIHNTTVLTPSGYIPVQKLNKGDTVITSDKRKVKIVEIFKTEVKGSKDTYPCVIPKGSIYENYPSKELRISQTHLIKVKNYWICPKNYFSTDKTFKDITYYHIQLKNYCTDHLVINDGVIVESLGVSKTDNIEYYNRVNLSILLQQIESQKSKSEIQKGKSEIQKGKSELV